MIWVSPSYDLRGSSGVKKYQTNLGIWQQGGSTVLWKKPSSRPLSFPTGQPACYTQNAAVEWAKRYETASAPDDKCLGDQFQFLMQWEGFKKRFRWKHSPQLSQRLGDRHVSMATSQTREWSGAEEPGEKRRGGGGRGGKGEGWGVTEWDVCLLYCGPLLELFRLSFLSLLVWERASERTSERGSLRVVRVSGYIGIVEDQCYEFVWSDATLGKPLLL